MEPWSQLFVTPTVLDVIKQTPQSVRNVKPVSHFQPKACALLVHPLAEPVQQVHRPAHHVTQMLS
jgi:hypothetical protein